MRKIKNFVQLTEHIATAGQPREDEFKLIAEAGYQYVINLGLLDHKEAIRDEDKIVTDLGLSYIHIPVAFDEPRKEQVKFFCELLSSLRGSKVFVHCIMNFRVSAFMYHYLSKMENLPEHQARSIMFNYWEVDPIWSELLEWTSPELGLNETFLAAAL